MSHNDTPNINSIPENRRPYWCDDHKCCLLPLPHGAFALVDEQDLELVEGILWSKVEVSGGAMYAQARVAGKSVYLHRLLMDPSGGMVVDHINHDGLDNRRANLRVVTNQQNLWNRTGPNRDGTSGYIGVTYDKSRIRNPWLARMRVNGETEYLGGYPSPEQAALAYDKRALEVRGDFARLNFPKGAVDNAKKEQG